MALKALDLWALASVLVVARRSLPLVVQVLLRQVRPGLLAAAFQGAMALRSFARRHSHRLLVRVALSQMGNRMHLPKLRLLLSLCCVFRMTFERTRKICLAH